MNPFSQKCLKISFSFTARVWFCLLTYKACCVYYLALCREKFVNPWSIDFCYQFCFIHNNTHTTTIISRHDLLISFALSLFKFRCAPGYTGSPSSPGGSCQECECDPLGSLPVPCDPVTGICTCRPGATGPKCDGCEQGHAREGMECVCTYANLIIASGGLVPFLSHFQWERLAFFFFLIFQHLVFPLFFSSCFYSSFSLYVHLLLFACCFCLHPTEPRTAEKILSLL